MMAPALPLRWSRGTLERVSVCPACGGEQRDPRAFCRRDNEVLMPDVWNYYRCAQCRSVYLDPRPDEKSLPVAYSSYYTHYNEIETLPEGKIGGLLWSLIHGYLNVRFGLRRSPATTFGFLLFKCLAPFRLKLDYYGRHLAISRFPQRGRLLDVGCGNGAFLLRAQEMGWKVVGCEPDADAVSACRRGGLGTIVRDVHDATLIPGSFDVITMSHVIEHVDDPKALLERCHRLLRAGGMLWIATPNPQGFGFRTFQEHWIHLHPPFHLCIPSQAQLRALVFVAGFRGIRAIPRGAHARNNWAKSLAIVGQEKGRCPSRPLAMLTRYACDLFATVSGSWAEETVLIAYKPGIPDDH